MRAQSEPHPMRTTWQASMPGNGAPSPQLTAAEVKDLVSKLARFPGQVFRVLQPAPDRNDTLVSIVAHAVRSGFRVELEADPLAGFDDEFIGHLAKAGAAEVLVRVDDSSADRHDELRGVAGDFAHAIRVLRQGRAAGLATAVHTVLQQANVRRLPQLAQLVQQLEAGRWLVGPEVRGGPGALSCARLESAIKELATIAARERVPASAIHAPFFLRLCEELGFDPPDGYDERWGLYVSARGEVMPDAAIQILVGNVRDSDALELFTRHPLLRALRDPDSVEGKCGECRFRPRCGGSRARALAETGNVFASDPACTFVAT